MIRRPPRSTLDRSSAASDVYKRQDIQPHAPVHVLVIPKKEIATLADVTPEDAPLLGPVSYTHLRAHETVLDLVCRLLLEKKNKLAIVKLI